MTLTTDSREYNLMTDAVKLIRDVPGFIVELGVRQGGGLAQLIQTAINQGLTDRDYLGIDPWGNIDYETSEGVVTKHDYTNQMRNECLKDLYTFILPADINLIIIPLEDTEFFNRYPDGVPVYKNIKKIINQYAFVVFDGPHAVSPLMTEIDFFESRTCVGSVFVFDDIDKYPHDVIEQYLFRQKNWKLVSKGTCKAVYQKIS